MGVAPPNLGLGLRIQLDIFRGVIVICRVDAHPTRGSLHRGLLQVLHSQTFDPLNGLSFRLAGRAHTSCKRRSKSAAGAADLEAKPFQRRADSRSRAANELRRVVARRHGLRAGFSARIAANHRKRKLVGKFNGRCQQAGSGCFAESKTDTAS